MSYPQPPPPPAISKADEDQLDLLSIGFWVYGALMGFGGVAVGGFGLLPALAAFYAPTSKSSGPPPWVVGGVFAAVIGVIALLLVAKAVVMILAGSALKRRRGYLLCMVGAALAVMNIPLGTALAIFTFMLLNKPEIKQRFEAGA